MSTYHPVTSHTEDAIDFVIHVLPAIAEEDLDESDLDDQGNCIVSGRYRISILPGRRGPLFSRNQALEIFHALDIIYDPDDYRLVVSTYSSGIDRILKDDLGVWTEAVGARRAPRTQVKDEGYRDEKVRREA